MRTGKVVFTICALLLVSYVNASGKKQTSNNGWESPDSFNNEKHKEKACRDKKGNIIDCDRGNQKDRGKPHDCYRDGVQIKLPEWEIGQCLTYRVTETIGEEVILSEKQVLSIVGEKRIADKHFYWFEYTRFNDNDELIKGERFLVPYYDVAKLNKLINSNKYDLFVAEQYQEFYSKGHVLGCYVRGAIYDYMEAFAITRLSQIKHVMAKRPYKKESVNVSGNVVNVHKYTMSIAGALVTYSVSEGLPIDGIYETTMVHSDNKGTTTSYRKSLVEFKMSGAKTYRGGSIIMIPPDVMARRLGLPKRVTDNE